MMSLPGYIGILMAAGGLITATVATIRDWRFRDWWLCLLTAWVGVLVVIEALR